MFFYWTIAIAVFIGGVLLGYLVSRYLVKDDLEIMKGGILHCDISQKDPSFYMELHKAPGELITNGYVLLSVQVDDEPTLN